MKPYEDFDIEDFATDDSFINWCLQPNSTTIDFWQKWIKAHPEKQTTVDSAKQLVLDLQAIEEEAHNESFAADIWTNIEANTTKKPQRRRVRLFQIAAAASILLCVGAYFLSQNKSPVQITEKVAWINIDNNSGLSKTIELADKSTVVLEPFSTLKYPTIFNNNQRTVFLQGEAFFDIAKDTLKPFLVYANETVTKVLGTSFTVTAFEGEKTVEVEVKTGKVAVYANVKNGVANESTKQMIIETDEKIIMPLPNKKIDITPNQKVIFNKKQEKMTRTIAKLPQVIIEIEELPQFNFDNESVVKVFKALELAYGIDIEFDEANLEKCKIKTKLTNEPLLEKLNILCTALNLTFSEEDATIFIKGKGCNQ